MANILDTIVASKFGEVEQAKAAVSAAQLEQSPFFSRSTLSLKASLSDPELTGIIAEFKRRSPSKGLFLADADPVKITEAYTAAGASGLSVLTDHAFFGGSREDLIRARVNSIPVLRKDFMIDEYQIVEARSMGADVILLIAACLQPAQVQSMARFAHSLGLEVLLEIHNEDELRHICDEVDLVGVNNRDLKTFTVDIDTSIRLGAQIPAGKTKISESGISDVTTIALLKDHGFEGFLLGEAFMKEPDPAIAFTRFVHQLKHGVS